MPRAALCSTGTAISAPKDLNDQAVCGRPRLRASCGPVGLETDLEPGSGRPRDAFKGSGRRAGSPPFQTGNDRLGRFHPLRQFLLCQSGMRDADTLIV